MLGVGVSLRYLRGTTAIDPYKIAGFKPPLVLDFIEDYYRTGGSASTFDDALNFSRASAATYTDADGVLQTAAAGVPRVGNHVYNGSEWVNEGLLLESESRTNLASQSNNPSGWSAVNIDFTANAGASPDGLSNATKLASDNATGGYVGAETFNVVGGDQYTASAWFKADEIAYVMAGFTGASFSAYTASFDLSTGTFSAANGGYDNAFIEGRGDGWFRCAVVATADSDGLGAFSFYLSNDGLWSNRSNAISVGDGLLIYGIQIEQGSTPSSYIPTSGSTVTRAAETLDVAAADMPWPEPVVIGDNLVTNGTFDTDISGWTAAAAGASATFSGGRIRITQDSGTYGSYSAPITCEIGKVYRASGEFAAESNAANTAHILISTDAGNYNTNRVNIANNVGTVGEYSGTFVATATTHYVHLLGPALSPSRWNEYDNISVREIETPAVSIQMDGAMTGESSTFADWTADASNGILVQSGTNDFTFTQEDDGTVDTVTGGSFTAGVNVPFNIASRHGSTFINGAVDGTAFTADTTPTALPDLSTTDFDIGPTFMGNIGKLRVWAEDLGDEGIEEASA